MKIEKPKIKICGLMTEKDVRLVHKYKADYAGIVMFCEKSKRNNSLQSAWKLTSLLGDEIRKVAVCVSPTVEQLEMIEHMQFDIIQVHGGLSDAVKEKSHLPIFRAYNIKDGIIPKAESDDKIIGYLLDGAVPGNGSVFDWTAFQQFDFHGKLKILAGGLTAENVAEGIRQTNPDIVDVSSYVERKDGPGKDEEKMKLFMKQVRDL